MLRYGIAAVLLIAGGFAAYHFLLRPAGKTTAAVKAPVHSTVVLPSITTNLADANQVRLVQVQVTATLVGSGAQAQWTKKLPAIQDVTIATLRTRTAKQLGAPDALTKLAVDLAARYDNILGAGGSVAKLYFTKFVVQ